MKWFLRFLPVFLVLIGYNGAIAGFGFKNPSQGLGFAVGGGMGDNSNADNWVLQYRGFLQYQLIAPGLLGQLGVGYTRLDAPGVYTAGTTMVENRFLFVPFSLEKLNPFLYGGFGVSKCIDRNGSDFLPMIPMGIGFQTRVHSQMILEVSGGYTLSLRDKLDGRERSDSNLNHLTNKKQDGFFGFVIGLMFTGGSANGTDDQDKDGLNNTTENEMGTDPNNADTDGDGLSDGSEVNRYLTNPLKSDTDGDGLYDGTEVKRFKTDPLRMDTDGDGLNDGDEFRYKSNPLRSDTDQDGLNDGDEVSQYKTDPAKADTDGDGLRDGYEVHTAKTNPVKIDTDNGGVNDGAEVKRGTNPLDWRDDIAKGTKTIILDPGKKVILRGIHFEFDQANLTEDSREILEIAYQALIDRPDVLVEISGHTDNIGSDEYNQDLSLRRAQAVKNWLEQRGVLSDRMRTVGKGEMEPIDDNDTEEGRTENRRIEFYVQQ
jgi:outer membrane protein OmpA-like peptidoglycan-associated protein